MRVRHLTDFEIQGLLDRRQSAFTGEIPGRVYRKDLDAQEHVDNCTICRAEVELYRELFGDLGRSEQVCLPRNFARKVTFSLPPFKAYRTAARLKMAGIWGLAALVTMIWFLGQVNWPMFFTWTLSTIIPKCLAVQAWFTEITADWSLPDLSWQNLWSAVMPIIEVVQNAFASEGGAVNLFILAGIAILLIELLDQLYVRATFQQNSIR